MTELWDGFSEGTKQYENTAIVHRGYDHIHSTVFIQNEDFFQEIPWDFPTLFEHGFVDGFVFGNDELSPHHWGLGEQLIDSLPHVLATELKRWKTIHQCIHVWVETISPEWSSDYFRLYYPIHLIRIVPSRCVQNWRVNYWPARPKIRRELPYFLWGKVVTFKDSSRIRALSAESMKRSIETNLVDKEWRLFTPIVETQRCVIQGYNKIKFHDGLAAQICDTSIPMSIQARHIWNVVEEDDETYNVRSPSP